MLINPITNEKMRNFYCFALERQYAALALRLSLNLIAVQKMAT